MRAGVIVLGCLFGLLAGHGLGDEPPTLPPQRSLQGDDARKATELFKRLQSLQAAAKFEEALPIAEELAELRTRAQGREHGEAVDARYVVVALRKALVQGKEVREAYAASFALHRLAASLQAREKYREAQVLLEKVLEVRRKVLGAEHPDIAQGCNDIAFNLDGQERYGEAEEFYRKALAVCRNTLGEDNLHTAQTYHNAAWNLNAQGKYREAAEGYRKALEVRRKVLGEDHPDTATSYGSVAANLNDQGQHAAAESGLRKALDIVRKALGEEHPDTATSYGNIAANLNAQGRWKEAEAGYLKALAIRRKVLGEEHSDTAESYNGVAANLEAQGRYKEAEEGFRKALAIWRKVLGEDHHFTATGYNNVATNLDSQERSREAEEFYGKALAIWRKALGEDHPDTATCWNNLAHTVAGQGRFKESEEGLRKALAIRRKMLGEEHPDTATSYNNVAANLNAQGRYKEAEELYTRGAEAFLQSRLKIAASGLERAARSSELSPLFRFSALLARIGKPAAAWRRLEQGLGRGAWDDLSARMRRPARELARQTELVKQLERVDRLLARHSIISKPTPGEEREREDLLERRRLAQEELSRFQHHLEEEYGPAQGQVFDRTHIQAALPLDTALVAWIDIPAAPKATDPNGEHWGVVLRAQGEPIFERLRGSGPDGSWTQEDDILPQRLRIALQSSRREWRDLALRVAEQRVKPLRRHLAAGVKLPAASHLVILPSTALAGVPLEAVADEFTVSYASSGTLYAHLRKQPAVKGAGLLALGDPVFEVGAGAPKERPLPPGGVLLTLVQPGSNAAQSRLRPDDVLLRYGGVELKTPADLKAALAAADRKAVITVHVWREGVTFEGAVGSGPLGVVLASDPAPRALAERYRLDRVLATRSGDADWGQLPGTRVEVESLRRLFSDSPLPRLLFDSEASEQNLDELAASGELGKYRYLHLATHGEVDNAWPLRSALILSRDTLPDPQQQLLAGKPVYDGRLTAEEILRSWNLHADLVTLSACETALGKYERGEGFMGFAQALLLSGSRCVCLSLWKVDDAATALLMQRFYTNLLGKREGLKAPMPKAAALREAKEWLRKLSREEALRVAAEVSQGVERGKGRPKGKLLPPLPEPGPPGKEDRPYAHPYYWAAFILIGDPG
jgi:tetratricopeptide (TPR) repeat protein